jgi:RNA polymerase sigma factor (sigma-70 family)
VSSSRAHSFDDLISAARGGSNSALLELLSACSSQVYAAIRRRLPAGGRRRFDSDDIAQAVWASFFAQTANFRRFQDLEEMVNFLAQMARNKLVDNARHELRQRRDERRTVPLDSQLHDNLAADQPRPSQIISRREDVDRALQSRTDRERTILELRSQGLSHAEIATELSMHPGSVRRILARCISEMQSGPQG